MLLTIGAVATAALVPTTFTSQAAYAQDGAHHPYKATCHIDGFASPGPGQNPLTCTLSPAAPPQNVQTVIQSLDISLDQFETTSGIDTPLYTSLTGYSATGAVTFVPFTSTPTDPTTMRPP